MKKKQSVTSLVIGLIAVAAFALYEQYGDSAFALNHDESAHQASANVEQDNASLREVIAQNRSGVMVTGTAQVVKVLSDDRKGSAHQRFIVQLLSGETLLIAHNIDLAPRLPNLSENDSVTFKGQNEVNPKGGVIHWMHKDPQGHHEGGWIDYQGKRYQ